MNINQQLKSSSSAENLDLPQCEVDADGSQAWRLCSRLHITGADGRQYWYRRSHLHRTDGPALIRADGSQAWYLHGQRHRTDGPALIYADGSQHWFINGQDITAKVEAWMQARDVTWPWDHNTRVEFALTWS